MTHLSRFLPHRPELTAPLERGDAKIRELLAKHSRSVQAGTFLIEPEQPHQFVYRLVSGWAGRVRDLSDGRSQYILIFLPGDLFAVKSMYIPQHPDGVEAISDCVVDYIDQQALREACNQDLGLASRCTWQVVEEERRLHTWVVGLGQGNAGERLAFLFLDFRGRLITAECIAPNAMTYEMPMTQIQLADHLGISPVHVNRVLKEFRDQGLVSLRDRTVAISDFERLTQIAQPLLDVYERNNPIFVGSGRTSATS